MKVVIPGGSGQVGTILARALHAAGHDVVILSRGPTVAPWRIVRWDARSVGAWAAELEGADAVINLAGRSVNCRYTVSNRRAILATRVESTRAVGAAIAQAQHPARVWLQMSTASIYSHRYDARNDDASGIIGGAEPDAPNTWRFSIDVAKAREAAAGEQETPATRQVFLRTAMVMSPDRGGVFDTLLRLVRNGLGGEAAGGRQYVSWIHHMDFVRAVVWLIDHAEMEGAVNLAAPHPLPNRDFMSALRAASGVPVGLPATAWMLEVGAIAMRTETELVLKSRRVVPGRLVKAGFAFEYPEWAAAARALCDEWRVRAASPAL
jgi:uncharacterized protein (TIGR01777 family)